MSSEMVSPPREEDFNNFDDGDEKMDMSLDQIIKMNRTTRRPSPSDSVQVGRSHYRNERPPRDAREDICRSVASRSSAMRQGKFSEARNRNGSGIYSEQKFGGQNRPMNGPPPMRGRGWNRNRNDPQRRNGFPRKPLMPGEQVHIFDGAAGKLKISVVNENTKMPVQQPVTANRGRNHFHQQQQHHHHNQPYNNSNSNNNWGNGVGGRSSDLDFDYGGRMQFPFGSKQPPQQQQQHHHHHQQQQRQPHRQQMDTADRPPPLRRHRTLDALFASIKERREMGRLGGHFNPAERFRRP